MDSWEEAVALDFAHASPTDPTVTPVRVGAEAERGFEKPEPHCGNPLMFRFDETLRCFHFNWLKAWDRAVEVKVRWR